MVLPDIDTVVVFDIGLAVAVAVILGATLVEDTEMLPSVTFARSPDITLLFVVFVNTIFPEDENAPDDIAPRPSDPTSIIERFVVCPVTADAVTPDIIIVPGRTTCPIDDVDTTPDNIKAMNKLPVK